MLSTGDNQYFEYSEGKQERAKLSLFTISERILNSGMKLNPEGIELEENCLLHEVPIHKCTFGKIVSDGKLILVMKFVLWYSGFDEAGAVGSWHFHTHTHTHKIL